jgi:CheY-like chemotaxis protein
VALDILSHQPVDLAIVDYNMFPLDGVEFTRLVRTGPDSANIYLPIIMMSGHAEKSRIYAARDAGVTEFLVKPITAKAILDRINAVILKPRAFIKTSAYCGPCRRRRDVEASAGPFRRAADSRRSPRAA